MSSPSRPPRALLPGLLCLSAALLASCADGAPPPQGPGATPVTVVTLRSEPVLVTRELPGRTRAFLVAEVRPQVNGIVQRQLFTEGGTVQAGQALYQLDDAMYRADFATAKAALERARALHHQAEVDARRSEQLRSEQVISAADHERAVAASQTAAADVRAAEAALQRASVLLGYARIPAPISGRIGKSSVTRGALVTAAQPLALTTVQQLDPIYVDLTQSSAELLQLRKAIAAGKLERADGTPVTLLLEDGSPYTHQGKLTFADVTVDPGTGSFALRVVVPNPDQLLLPGMYVRARIGNGVREEGLLVPQQAVARDPKGNTTAMVVGRDGKVEVREVRVSRTLGDKWLVEGGLAAGDRVIVEGLQKVQPGTPVDPTEAAPQPGGAALQPAPARREPGTAPAEGTAQASPRAAPPSPRRPTPGSPLRGVPAQPDSAPAHPAAPGATAR